MVEMGHNTKEEEERKKQQIKNEISCKTIMSINFSLLAIHRFF